MVDTTKTEFILHNHNLPLPPPVQMRKAHIRRTRVNRRYHREEIKDRFANVDYASRNHFQYFFFFILIEIVKWDTYFIVGISNWIGCACAVQEECLLWFLCQQNERIPWWLTADGTTNARVRERWVCTIFYDTHVSVYGARKAVIVIVRTRACLFIRIIASNLIIIAKLIGCCQSESISIFFHHWLVVWPEL